MANKKIRYLTERPNKGGVVRYYWQPDKTLKAAGWKMQPLGTDLSTAIAKAEAQNTLVDQWRAGQIEAPANEEPGTVDAVIVAYRKSRKYKKLRPRTRKDYDHYLKAISTWAGDQPAASVTAKAVQRLYEAQMEKSPRKAQYLIQVLRLLFNFAERESMIPKDSNPATKPDTTYKAAKGVVWTREQVAHFVRTADRLGHFSIGTAVKLDEWIGQRKGDVLTLRMNAYRNGIFFVTQSKTGAEVPLPVDMVPDLKSRIEEQIERNRKANSRNIVGTFLIQQRSRKAYTGDGFNSSFDTVMKEACASMPGMKGLVFKNLRHTAVTRLAEAGASIPQIASITGHSFDTCQEIIDRYNIRTTAMAREAFQHRLNYEAAGKGDKA